MTLNLLKPATGQAKRPSEIRENMQYILGAALPDCILPNADGTFGGKITVGSNLAVDVSGFRSIIAGKYHEIPAFTVNTTARRAQLLYATKNAANDSVTPTIGVLTAVFPAADAGTVCRWIIDGSATIASTVGSNDLIRSGTITQVSGWANDYAGKGDGSTGYYTAANTTGLPSGSNVVIEMSCLVTVAGVGTRQALVSYGTNQSYTNTMEILANGNIGLDGGGVDTGFTVENGKTYWIVWGTDGTYVFCFINGSLIYKNNYTLISGGAAPAIGKYVGSYTFYTVSTIHYVELRNALRTPAQIAAISNALLLPCRCDSPDIVIPETAVAGYGGIVSNAYDGDASTQLISNVTVGGGLRY